MVPAETKNNLRTRRKKKGALRKYLVDTIRVHAEAWGAKHEGRLCDALQVGSLHGPPLRRGEGRVALLDMASNKKGGTIR